MVEIDQHTFAVELINGNVHVNLTQMAKPFGKTPKDWLRTEESSIYLRALAVRQKCPTADLVKIRQGGSPDSQGTWTTDRRIAIRFAQWLSPQFSIAVDELLFKLISGNAIVAEPIAGVWPIMQNGLVGYPRKEILQASGYSYTSGSVSSLKRRFPTDNFHILRVACLSPRLANLVHERGKVRQLELNLFAKPALKGGL